MRVVFLTDAVLILIIVASLGYGCAASSRVNADKTSPQDQHGFPMLGVDFHESTTGPGRLRIATAGGEDPFQNAKSFIQPGFCPLKPIKLGPPVP